MLGGPGLGAGAIAGIVIGVLVLVAVIVGTIVLVVTRSSSARGPATRMTNDFPATQNNAAYETAMVRHF